METIKTLYNLLQVNRKIENEHIRLLYLKDIWGLEQSFIGELEGGMSQSYISKELIKARSTISRKEFDEGTRDLWTPEEIQYIHMLPREILPDIAAIAFINDILGFYPMHGFFDYLDTTSNARIAALAWLGIQNKRLTQIFHKQQPTVSMIVKRSMNKVSDIIRPNRYDSVVEYKFSNKPQSHKKFTLAGGIE